MTEITKQKLSATNFCHTWHEICCWKNRSAHRTKQERTEKRKKSLVTFLFSLNLRPQLKTVWSLRRTFITSLYFISGLTKHRPRWEPNLNFHNGGHGVFLSGKPILGFFQSQYTLDIPTQYFLSPLQVLFGCDLTVNNTNVSGLVGESVGCSVNPC